ncbi:MAG TPA: TraR/DksA family transcriptional regulator [Thermodesulfobacteriota bacterium]
MANGVDGARARLLERRRALLATVAGVETELKGLENEIEVEFVEQGQEETMARLLSRLDLRARHELEEIEAALRRLAAGEYGRCELCGEAIAPARLEALPTTRLCLGCAEARERAEGPTGGAV